MKQFRSALTQYDDYYSMMSDTIRMRAYSEAINSTVKPGDVVVDLGCGTGILSFLALKAGAKKVYAIEKSDAIELAKAIAQHNGFTDSIEFINENSKDVTLPQKADILLSETLGSFGLDENTLDFTIDARDRFLKEDARLIPQGLELFLAPATAPHCNRKIEFWRSVEGVDFSPAREIFGRKLMVETIKPRNLLTKPLSYAQVDLYTANSRTIQNKLLFKFQYPGDVHGIGGWFNLALTDTIHLTTAPGKPETHWKQAFFPILEQIQVIAGDVLELTMGIAKQEEKSDNTLIDYQYRCTQLANEAPSQRQINRNSPCPCGSGKKFKRCC
ncbi:MAG: 50S ribosomal protein L11 methyltransferase, partial [Magnetococcales bacterium]|nr:50S ribosomal protein L11 methyltransferase [Magnetococcales bacterium]